MKYQKYDVATGQEFVGDIQTEDIQLANSLICELDGANIGTIAIDDVVYILGNGKIIKAIANNAYCNYQLGIVKSINGTSYTVQVDGIVEHSQPLTNDLSKEVYATSDKSGRNLVDKLEVPFFNDDTAVVVGKKLSSNKIKLSPDFFIFGDPEPNFVNDETAMVHFPFNSEYGRLDKLGNVSTSYTFASGVSEPTFENDMFGNTNASIKFDADGMQRITIINNQNAIDTLRMGYDSMTVVCYFKINQANPINDSSCIFHFTASLGSNEGYGFYYRSSQNKINAITKKLGIAANTASTYGIGLGTWYQIVNVHNRIDKSVTTYINSVQTAKMYNIIEPTDFVSSNQYTRIGAWSYDTAYQLFGNLSSLRVYRTAWDAEKVSRYWRYCNTWKVAL